MSETNGAATGETTETIPEAAPGGGAAAAIEPPAPSDERRKLDEIIGMNAEVTLLSMEHADKAEAAKAAKKRLEAAQDRLNSLIRNIDREKEKTYPLFDRAAVSGPAPEAWRSVNVSELCDHHGLPIGAGSKLYEAGIETVGAIADHTSKGLPLTDIPGVGPAKAEAIEAALVSFWAAQPKAEAGTPGDVIREVFTALLSVGHTEPQARAMIDAAVGRKTFTSVSDMIDSIYAAGAPDALDSSPIKSALNDELDAHFGGDGPAAGKDAPAPKKPPRKARTAEGVAS